MNNLSGNLIEPYELESVYLNPRVVLIDARDASDYARGHIPGAVSMEDIFYYIALPENGGLDGLQAHFSRLLGEAGVRPEDHVILYEDAQDNGYGKSCRGWMILKYLGHADARVLHGGYRAWKAAGYPIEQTAAERTPGEFVVRETPGYIIGLDEVRVAMEREDTVLLDCRDYAEWLGANSSPYGYDYCPRKGRIPGSRWLEWYRVMERVGGVTRLCPPEAVREMCQQIGITPEQSVIVYCFKGARASVVVMALRLAGFKNVTNYFSAWNEWSRDFSLAVDDSYPED